MDIDDLILVSVDDHVVEPPDMFEGHLPERYVDLAPQAIRNDAGDDVWLYEGQELPNIGLNAVAGKPPEEYGIEPTSFAEMRSGCYDVDDRVADMDANGILGSMCFPSFPQFCGQLFSRTEDKDVAMAMVRAYNDWHIDQWCGSHPGRFIPLAIPPDLESRAHGRGGPPGGGQGVPGGDVLREPGEAGLAQLPQRRTGTRSGRR